MSRSLRKFTERAPSPSSGEAGFSMIEVLVTLVIFVVAMLGLAGLQSTSISTNHSAYLRSQATWLTYDMVDRMRVNLDAVSAGDYYGGSGTQHTSCVSTSGCSTTNMAEHDLFSWVDLVQSTLPNGNGHVCSDSSPQDGTPGSPACDGSGPVAIKVWWYLKEAEETQRYTVSFEPG